jgi:TrmH family RNA methyltransferase
MAFHIVQSKQNSRLKQLRRALAAPGRGNDGVAGIEGPNLLAEALRAGLRMRTVFVAQGAESLIEELALAAGTECLLVAKALLNAALTTETPQPVAALVKPPEWGWADLLEGPNNTAPLVVVLVGLQDPGNLGTILRSAEAFGATGVVSLPGTVSAWNAKAVRASAGSVFRVPIVEADPEECFQRLREAGVTILTTTASGAEAADAANLTAAVAILIGNEGNGVPRELAAQADAAITIPCPGLVESLNAAVAASVLLYEASRQRSVRDVRAVPARRLKGARR